MKKLFAYVSVMMVLILLFAIPIIPVAIFGLAAYVSDVVSRDPGYISPYPIDVSDMSESMQNELYEFSYDPA
jgi:hypothetical protein